MLKVMQLVSKFFLLFVLISCEVNSQDSISVSAGDEYSKRGLHTLLWGKNRRKEWTAKVRVPVIGLDTIFGGLKPYKKGGGNESKSLRLISVSGKEYALRSVNKSRVAVIPKLLKNTYFGGVIQDGVSMSYPYGSLAVHEMMKSSNIYHPRAILVYLPKQPALDSFNNEFGDGLFTLEERPDGDWSSGASHLGGFNKFYSSEEVIEQVRADHQKKIDQQAFIKARLFDILIGDWDRNGGNWVWGADATTFKPIAKDRDQAFYTIDGFLMKIMTRLSGNGYMQNFSRSISDVGRFTKQDRAVDEIFTNEMGLTDWLNAAAELEHTLTDSIIKVSVSNLPPEIFNISGTELITKLQQRRNQLQQYATALYKVLASHVKIIATKENDHIQLRQTADGLVSIELFHINGNGEKELLPYFKRIVSSNETKRISINGFGGNDTFDVDPNIKKIKINTYSLEEVIPALKHS